MPHLVTKCFAFTHFLFLSGSSTKPSLVFLTKATSWTAPHTISFSSLYVQKQTQHFVLQSAHTMVEANLRCFLFLPCEVVWGQFITAGQCFILSKGQGCLTDTGENKNPEDSRNKDDRAAPSEADFVDTGWGLSIYIINRLP